MVLLCLIHLSQAGGNISKTLIYVAPGSCLESIYKYKLCSSYYLRFIFFIMFIFPDATMFLVSFHFTSQLLFKISNVWSYFSPSHHQVSIILCAICCQEILELWSGFASLEILKGQSRVYVIEHEWIKSWNNRMFRMKIGVRYDVDCRHSQQPGRNQQV